MKTDDMSLGDWCKFYEKNFTLDFAIPELPVILRFDGNNFHNWTKGLITPFDSRLSDLMIETTKFIVSETGAEIGFTQSDEITIILYSDNCKTLLYGDGKKQKILSKLTAKVVNFFNEKRKTLIPNHDKTAIFDCRMYQVPTLEWACKQLLWRELDATKNSIYTLARSLFSHKSLQNLNGSQLQDKMMLEKSVNWNDLETRFKRGTYVSRKEITKKFTIEELSILPAKHEARKNPNLEFSRHVVEIIDMPIFSKVTNKVDVIFKKEKPILKNDN